MANIIALRRREPREEVCEASILDRLRLPALPPPSPAADTVLAFFREDPLPDFDAGPFLSVSCLH